MLAMPATSFFRVFEKSTPLRKRSEIEYIVGRKQQLARRRTAASQQRMKIISQLAKNTKKEDDFGRNDDDWDVYKIIRKVNATLAKVCPIIFEVPAPHCPKQGP